MRHMRPDEMARTQGAVQTQLARQHAGSDDASKLARVVAGCFLVSAAHAEEV